MILKSLSLNHDANNLHDALALSTKSRTKCRERVFFSVFANYLQGKEFYEDEDDIPSEFTTKTGDLSRTLSITNDPLEYEYTLLMFMKLQDVATNVTAKYQMLNSPDTSAEDVFKLKMMDSMMELMVEKERTESPEDSEYILSPTGMNKRLEMVKASRYNWETYYNMIAAEDFFNSSSSSNKKTRGGNDFDVDDMLRNVLGD